MSTIEYRIAKRIIDTIRTAPIANGSHIGQKHHHHEMLMMLINLRIHKRMVIPRCHPPMLIANFPSCIF